MTPSDNVYYFGNDIDVRLCLKNGYTTLRTAWVAYNPDIPVKEFLFDENGELQHDGWGGTLNRYHDIYKQQDPWDIPFRENSFKIAVKRDPVKRFISAVSYLQAEKNRHNHMQKKKAWIDLTHVDETKIDELIYKIQNKVIKDEHFFSQSYFLGTNKDHYDKVYDLSEMGELLKFLSSKVTMRVPVEKLWVNKTRGTSNIITLTKDQEIKVIKLYARDYANGWC